jgi:hypothetical protein
VSDGPAFHDLSCLVHVHSTYSDGTATVTELLDEAREAGAEALLLTDHDTLGAREDGREGDRDGVFLLVGVEVSPRDGHYLAFGVDHPIEHRGLSQVEIAAAVRATGGVGFAAHPFSRGGRMLAPGIASRIIRPHDWPAIEHDGGTDGIEVWSVLTDAAESWRTPAEAIRWLRNPEAHVAAGPPEDQLRIWDALSASRRVPAVGGLDDHQRGFRIRGRVRSPVPHRRTFHLVRTHLLCERPLSGDVGADRETIVSALRSGSAWINCPFVAPAHGARLWAEREDGALLPMGGEGTAGRAVLRLRLPRSADLLVLRDGTAIERADAAELDLEISDPGAYRVEARIDGRLWLLSNPVHLR